MWGSFPPYTYSTVHLTQVRGNRVGDSKLERPLNRRFTLREP